MPKFINVGLNQEIIVMLHYIRLQVWLAEQIFWVHSFLSFLFCFTQDVVSLVSAPSFMGSGM